MKRRDNIERMKRLMDELLKGKKPAKKAKAKKEKKIEADVNKDGKVDEKDLDLVSKAIKKAKKIVKKK